MITTFPSPLVGAQSAGTSVSGTISEDTTWAFADSPYTVTGHVVVASGKTLTIEPGVMVKFDSGKALEVEGTLVARGTSSNKVTFTSSAASPSAGDWGHIKFKDGLSGSAGTTFDGSGNYVSGSILEYCNVEYGGAYEHVIENATYINACTFTNNSSNSSSGIGTVDASFYAGDGMDPTYESVRITNSVFSQNIGGIGNAMNATIKGNTIENNSGGIGVLGGDTSITDNVIRNGSSWGAAIWGNLKNNGASKIWETDYTVVISGNHIRDQNGTGIHIFTQEESSIGPITATISNNIIVRNSGKGIVAGDTPGGGGPTGVTINVTGNYIADNGGSGIYVWDHTPKVNVRYNKIHNNNGADGSALYIRDVLDESSYAGAVIDTYEYNTITGGIGTSLIYKNRGNPIIRNNNIIHKSETYLVYDTALFGANATFDFENNWWGTTDTTNLDALIYDWNDNPTKEQVDYTPFLIAPDTTAPPSPPTNVAAQTGPTTISLAWDANPESDIAGYKVHYDTDAAGYPYANSTDVGNVTSYTLSGLSAGTTHYTAVSAYDGDGNDSWVSSDVSAIPLVNPTKLAFTTQPLGALVGATFVTLPVITIQGNSGDTATGSTAPVTLVITSGTGTGGATLSGTVTVSAVAGVATFPDLSIDMGGSGYTLTASSGDLTGATSDPFAITVGIPSRLAITTEPVGGPVGSHFNVQPIVTIQDDYGNTVTTSTANVHIVITPGSSQGNGATLSGTTTVAAVNGIATFTDLSIDQPGLFYTLTSTTPDHASAVTSTLAIVAFGAAPAISPWILWVLFGCVVVLFTVVIKRSRPRMLKPRSRRPLRSPKAKSNMPSWSVLPWQRIAGGIGILFLSIQAYPFFIHSIIGQVASSGNAMFLWGVLKLLGKDPTIDGTVVGTPVTQFIVIPECTIFAPLALFVAGVAFFPSTVPEKLRAIVGGALILSVVNLVRLVSLYLVLESSPSVFESVHLFVWQPMMAMTALVTWGIWAGRRTRHG